MKVCAFCGYSPLDDVKGLPWCPRCGSWTFAVDPEDVEWPDDIVDPEDSQGPLDFPFRVFAIY